MLNNRISLIVLQPQYIYLLVVLLYISIYTLQLTFHFTFIISMNLCLTFILSSCLVAFLESATPKERAEAMVAQMNITEKFDMMSVNENLYFILMKRWFTP